MRHGSIRLALAGLLLGVALQAAPAQAQFDLTGSWQVHVMDADITFDFTQIGSNVFMTESGLSWEGTIDTGIGVFSVHATDQTIAIVLQCGLIDAAMTPDGNHFDGDFSTAPVQCTGLHPPICQCGTFTLQSSAIGTRLTGGPVCGNGAVEAGEQCDDGNTVGGDCCSATCTFESAGAACADAEACTYDTCDGAGACTHGPYPGCRTASQDAAISLRDDGGGGGQLRWGWKDASGQTALADFGLPTATTDYHLCLFAGGALLFAGDVPPGTAWQQSASGFAHKSAGSAPDGIGTLKLRAGGQTAKLLAKGKGPLVAFAGALDVPAVRAQLVRDAGAPCWESTFDAPKLSTPSRFLARD